MQSRRATVKISKARCESRSRKIDRLDPVAVDEVGSWEFGSKFGMSIIGSQNLAGDRPKFLVGANSCSIARTYVRFFSWPRLSVEIVLHKSRTYDPEAFYFLYLVSGLVDFPWIII